MPGSRRGSCSRTADSARFRDREEALTSTASVHRETSSSPRTPARPAWLRHGVALACVVLGCLVRKALTPVIGPTALPFITFFPAVAVAAWFGGLGPGVLA